MPTKSAAETQPEERIAAGLEYEIRDLLFFEDHDHSGCRALRVQGDIPVCLQAQSGKHACRRFQFYDQPSGKGLVGCIGHNAQKLSCVAACVKNGEALYDYGQIAAAENS